MPENETGGAGEPSWMPPSVLAPMDERALVADLTRAALAAEIPEELGVFAADEDRYLDGWRGEASRESDEMLLGFGLETVALLTPYIVAAATVALRLIAEAFAQSVTAEAKPHVVQWIHQLFHREPTQARDLPPSLSADLIRFLSRADPRMVPGVFGGRHLINHSL